MGQSTDAYLFYGYCWNDEIDLLHNDPEDQSEWYEIVANREGHRNPYDLYRMSGREDLDMQLPYAERMPAFTAWKEEVGFDTLYADWTAVTDEIKARYNGIDISSHCSCDYPMPYIYIVESEQRAWRGEGKQLDLLTLASGPTDTWDQDLNRFVQEVGIDISAAEGLGWFLVSNWC